MDFRVFQHATEDRDKVLSALRTVSGAGEVKDIRADGCHGNPILILEAAIANRAELEGFWERLRAFSLVCGVGENLEERINDEGELFIRFDKQDAVAGRLALSSGDDVILAWGRVLTRVRGQDVRADRGTAIEVMRRFLSELSADQGVRGPS
jgi:hypothetical protein